MTGQLQTEFFPLRVTIGYDLLIYRADRSRCDSICWRMSAFVVLSFFSVCKSAVSNYRLEARVCKMTNFVLVEK